MTLRILYDGWPLAAQPGSSATLHLQTLLANHPPEIEAHIALPVEPAEPLPPGMEAHLAATGSGDGGRLRWEQSALPRVSRLTGAHLVHLNGGRPALFSGSRQLLSPGSEILAPNWSRSPGRRSTAARLGDALGQGGQARLQAILWPEDLPAPESRANLVRLPRITHPAFLAPVDPQYNPHASLPPGLSLPESYLLYHGPLAPLDIHRLLAAWSWAAPAIGQYYPLLIANVDQRLQEALLPVIRSARCEATARLLPPLGQAALAALYQGCNALFHPTLDSPWQSAIALALACARPVVALETPWSDALVGPAGYLVAEEAEETTSRALGAALITVVVEESVAESLSVLAAQRATAWSGEAQAKRFTRLLAGAYESLAA